MTADRQHLVIVSGLSGAGKSTALNALDDMGYHCVDNLPASLLQEFGKQLIAETSLYQRVALGVDARAPGLRLEEIPPWLEQLAHDGLQVQLLFLDASDDVLVKRFSETRRKHPLAGDEGSLQAAIARERVRRLIYLESDPDDGLAVRFRSRLLGRTVRVVLEQPDSSAAGEGRMTGRCDHYVPISVSTSAQRGTLVRVRVTDVDADRALGTIEPTPVSLSVL